MELLVAAGAPHLTALLVAAAFGFLVGTLGHVIGSRTMIITGILIVGMVSAYVVFVPGSG